MTENKVKSILKTFFTSRGLTLKDVVEKYNEAHPDQQMSLQSFSNKLSRGSIRFSEVIDILDVIGYQVNFGEKNDFVFKTRKSLNLSSCVIMGTYVEEAEVWLNTKIGTKKISKLDEIMLMHQASELFDVGFYAENGKIQIFQDEEQKQRFEMGRYGEM